MTLPALLPRRRLLGSALASALGLTRPATSPAPAPALPVVDGLSTVAMSAPFFDRDRPRRLRLLRPGTSVPAVPGEAPTPGWFYGDFLEVVAGPAGEFAIEDVDASGLPERPHPRGVRPSRVAILGRTVRRRSNVLLREWPTEAVGRCGLCKMGCGARPVADAPGVSFCIVNLPSPLGMEADASALALHRADYPRAHEAQHVVGGPAIPAPGPLVADEDRRVIEAALEELDRAVRAAPDGAAGLFRYLATRASRFGFGNCGVEMSGDCPGDGFGRLDAAFDGVWDLIEDRAGRCEDEQGRAYDEDARDAEIVRIVEAAIVRLGRA